MMIIWYLIAGFISGVLGGLGMGGGTLLIPILTIFFNFNQKLSQGINLMSFLVMALFSLFIHYKNGYIVTKNLSFIIISGVIFSCIGSLLISLMPSEVLKIIFGIFLCILSVIEFIKVFKK